MLYPMFFPTFRPMTYAETPPANATIAARIRSVNDGLNSATGVVLDAGPMKFAGSISVGCGDWLKSNEFIMGFAATSLVPKVGTLKVTSAKRRREANSYCV